MFGLRSFVNRFNSAHTFSSELNNWYQTSVQAIISRHLFYFWDISTGVFRINVMLEQKIFWTQSVDRWNKMMIKIWRWDDDDTPVRIPLTRYKHNFNQMFCVFVLTKENDCNSHPILILHIVSLLQNNEISYAITPDLSMPRISWLRTSLICAFWVRTSLTSFLSKRYDQTNVTKTQKNYGLNSSFREWPFQH